MMDLLLILILGCLVGWIAKYISLPAAVIQVLLGLIIGPPLLGWITPGDNLQLIGEFGVLLLLGLVGMQLGFAQLKKAGWAGFWVAVLGMGFCFAGGYLFTLWWGVPQQEALYVGTALTATSIGISVQVLLQFSLINRKVGQIVVAAAIIDDVVALYLLALVHSLLTDGFSASSMLLSTIQAASILAAVYFGCRTIVRVLLSRISHISPVYHLIIYILVITGSGWLTHWMGYSLVVGGFFSGMGIGDGLDQSQHRKKIIKGLEIMAFLLTPFFFVLIGTRADWSVIGDEGMWVLLVGLFVIAVTGKFFGGILGSVGIKGLTHRMLIGLSMAPRGEVALVIASIGFQQGHIGHHMLVALVLMAICTAIIAPLLMVPLAKRHGNDPGIGPYDKNIP